jgi:transcriptional regulator with XRE-family HTH domain
MRGRSEKEQAFVTAVGSEVARRRRELNMSQAELARRLGIKQVTMTTYETGRCAFSLYLLLRIANMLKVSLADLIGPAVRKVAATTNGELPPS